MRSEFIPPKNKRDLKQLDKAESQVGSMVSRASTKSMGGNIHKHCLLCDGKRIAGNHWAKHTRSVHIDIQFKEGDNFDKCTKGDCCK